jgi:predicted RNA-binding Zn ribbon-like protein
MMVTMNRMWIGDDITSDVALGVALDFVNTLEHSRDYDTEHLPSGTSLVAWLADHGMLGRAEAADMSARYERSGPAADRAIADARGLRKALRAVIDARVAERPPRASELDVVNRWLRRRAALRLVPGADGLALTTDPGDDPVRGALGRLAESAARGLVGDDPHRLRVCANDECRWVYYDTSKGGRRKWCDMAVCGNRAKARRHRERQAVDQSVGGVDRATT